MKPVNQEFVHNPETGQWGDCQRAVIASLLELPISEVPHFGQIAQGDSVVFYAELQKFVALHGYVYVTTHAKYGFSTFGLAEASVYHEISGPSPRGSGIYHAVVGYDGAIVFDPHPSRAGLAGDPDAWEFSFLVKR